MADVTGTGWSDDARDLLIARLNDLVTDSASDDPHISYVYDRHTRAYVQLNAASVDLNNAAQSWQGSDASDGPTIRWVQGFTIRVHTGREGYPVDGRTTMRLMESICNQLLSKFKLDSQYHIDRTEVSNNQTFAESYTTGGVVTVVIWRQVAYTQE